MATGNVSSRSAPAAALLIWPILIGLLTYLVLLGGMYPGVFAPDFRLADIVVAALVLFVWAGFAVRDVTWRPRTALWPAIFASIAAFPAATVGSAMPRLSAECLAYAVVMWALYLLLVRLEVHSFFCPERLDHLAFDASVIRRRAEEFGTEVVRRRFIDLFDRLGVDPSLYRAS